MYTLITLWLAAGAFGCLLFFVNGKLEQRHRGRYGKVYLCPTWGGLIGYIVCLLSGPVGAGLGLIFVISEVIVEASTSPILHRRICDR